MSRRKGTHYETQFVHACQDLGLIAERVPLSGGAGGSYTGDVIVEWDDLMWRFEVKFRHDGNGFKKLYEWIHAGALLYLSTDSALLRVCDLSTWSELQTRTDGMLSDFALVERETKMPFTQIHGWLKGAHALAVKMPRHRWLVIERLYRSTKSVVRVS